MGRIAKGIGLFAIGLAAGAATVALVTPKNGRAMRRALRKEARHGRDSAFRLARNVAGELRSAYESGRDAAGKLTSSFRNAS